MKTRVIFVCVHNSARSQMAAAFLKIHGGSRFEVESAGIEAGTLNPLVVRAMAERGIDISGNTTQKAQDLADRGERFDYVVTVCDQAAAERCPYFPGKGVRLHWSFPDPSALKGNEEEKLAAVRIIRDDIEAKVAAWLEELPGEEGGGSWI